MALRSARVKSYFLSPITTIPPEGPIRLGSIIEDPSYVQEPINNPPVPPSSAGEEVYLHNAANSTVTLNASKSFALGLFVKFQQLLQGKIGGKTSSAVEETWSFSNLQTQWFTPSDEYIKQSLQQMEVQEFIAQNYSWLRRTKLYMVTGVMVAEGASSAIKAAKQNELHLSLGVDTPLPQVPITVLPQLDLEGASGVTKSQGKSDTVVFAFQLRRIKISPAGDVTHAQYTDGTLLSVHKDTGPDKKSYQIAVDGIDKDDVNPAEFGLEGSSLDINDAMEEGG
ncbi:hypothetical protein TGAM01_v208610 [Trichoderma gamsii]|uniref:Uncharacterized protein n=1 Tax=Trichoderma gamsii TaxID=398673 RepID=A0A2P4ZE11_9HYPO|nr:hypothetical protein TGAM01_v208610 [Trichoderma gamsii]PON22526.1 hypothetical protein TGAM01_v208610 [Trichoderma gamsii]